MYTTHISRLCSAQRGGGGAHGSASARLVCAMRGAILSYSLLTACGIIILHLKPTRSPFSDEYIVATYRHINTIYQHTHQPVQEN